MTSLRNLPSRRNIAWDVVGEDYQAMWTPGHLPLDWRTRASACFAWGSYEGRCEALEVWQYRGKDGKPHAMSHNWECWAPPGEWYGGSYITWGDQTNDGPEGWVSLGEGHYCDVDGCDYDDAVCLDMEDWDQVVVDAVCAALPPEIHLVAVGDGWPWLSRITGPVTTMELHPR